MYDVTVDLTHNIPLKRSVGFVLTEYPVAKPKDAEGCLGWGFGGDSVSVCVPRATVNNVSSVTIKKEEKVFGILKWIFYSFH